MNYQIDKPISVLIIDDEPEIIQTMDRYLRTFLTIAHFHTANNIMAGIGAYKDHQIDLILLDLNMPGSSPEQTLKHVEYFTSGPNTILIVMTGELDNKYIDIAIWNGADDYFIKSSDPRELLEKIKYSFIKNSRSNKIQTNITTIHKLSSDDKLQISQLHLDLIQTLNEKVDYNGLEFTKTLAKLTLMEQTLQRTVDNVERLKKILYEGNGESIVSKLAINNQMIIQLANQFGNFIAEQKDYRHERETKEKEQLIKIDQLEKDKLELKKIIYGGYFTLAAVVVAAILEWMFDFIK